MASLKWRILKFKICSNKNMIFINVLKPFALQLRTKEIGVCLLYCCYKMVAYIVHDTMLQKWVVDKKKLHSIHEVG